MSQQKNWLDEKNSSSFSISDISNSNLNRQENEQHDFFLSLSLSLSLTLADGLSLSSICVSWCNFYQSINLSKFRLIVRDILMSPNPAMMAEWLEQ